MRLLPIYAVRWVAGRWLVEAPAPDGACQRVPFRRLVGVIKPPASSTSRQARALARTPDRREPDLLQLAKRLDRLCPTATRPHEFHEQKSEIAFALRKLSMRRA
jgi:hypothetical protein